MFPLLLGDLGRLGTGDCDRRLSIIDSESLLPFKSTNVCDGVQLSCHGTVMPSPSRPKSPASRHHERRRSRSPRYDDSRNRSRRLRDRSYDGRRSSRRDDRNREEYSRPRERRRSREDTEDRKSKEKDRQIVRRSKSRSASPEVDKSKPNFNPSGLLAAATNTVTHEGGKTTLLKYNEPPEARKPTQNWRLYIFKGDDETGKMYLTMYLPNATHIFL